jgi:hypothetical protein
LLLQKYKNIPETFIYFDIEPFVIEYIGQDISKLTLKLSQKFEFDFGYLADQLAIYPKAKIKLPSFSACYALFTPQSFEQSSSEHLALFKASLFSGRQLLDLTGGLGVDDWAFAKNFQKVVSVDIDYHLNKIVRRNFEKLGVSNVERLDDDAYVFVDKNVDMYDVIYVDSDRRSSEKRTHGLAYTEPDILRLKERLFQFTEHILLKVSPMLDLHAILNELKEVAEIWVVSSKNEVKEILIHLTPHPPLTPVFHAVEVDSNSRIIYSRQYDEIVAPKQYANDGLWFYEPSLTLIKSGLASVYMQEKGISQVAQHSIYGVSDVEVADFFGRRFHLYESFEFSKSHLKGYLSNNEITKANIAKRNFPMEVDEIRKLTRLKDGGEDYFFFTRDAEDKKLVFHCRRN